ncbi:MAG: DUF2090 domain-containing protein, partial [Gammaproteobacteria bacterium]|nr:DUF2090 domain-containing protein [Gammaproteobacteria bacterium]MBV9726765.1 DUF2090 domain-containing protein [Gammaproteobacteria bacterium]
YNVLGAGDAFLAGFLSGYVRGAPHEESARRGNACGALAVSRLLCSPEFATCAELEHFLLHGSRYRALRHDPELDHLHHVTTRRAQPAALRAFLIGARASPQGPTAATATASERLERLETLAVTAISRVAAGRTGFGVVLDAPVAAAAWREAARSGLWMAAAVHRRDSRTLEFPTASLALRLTEWPIDRTVYCRCEYHANDPDAVREVQERRLARLAAVCRAQRREWVLEIAAGAPDPLAGDALAGDALAGDALAGDALERVLSRLYSLDIRPDWWVLGSGPASDRCTRAAALISAKDRHCRGVLVALAAKEAPATLAAVARVPFVRGFIAGGSITTHAAEAYLAGRLSDEAAMTELAEAFAALVDAWERSSN